MFEFELQIYSFLDLIVVRGINPGQAVYCPGFTPQTTRALSGVQVLDRNPHSMGILIGLGFISYQYNIYRPSTSKLIKFSPLTFVLQMNSKRS